MPELKLIHVHSIFSRFFVLARNKSTSNKLSAMRTIRKCCEEIFHSHQITKPQYEKTELRRDYLVQIMQFNAAIKVII